MNFDEKLKELQKITEQMEDPDLSMSEGVNLYEKGIELAKSCYEELNSIKGKVNIIKQDLDKYKEEVFE